MRLPYPLRPLSTLLLLALLASRGAAPPARAEEPPVDAFLCRAAGGAERPATPAADLTDHLGSAAVELRGARRLCEPVSLGTTPPVDGATHLAGHRVRAPRGAWPRRPGVPVSSAIGAEPVDIERPALVLVPAAVGTDPTAPDPAAHGVDAYHCHRARRSDRGAQAGPQIDVTAADGRVLSLALGAPRLLCSPAERDGGGMKHPSWSLACYAARPGSRADRPARVRDLGVASDLGTDAVDVAGIRELCLPAHMLPACNGSPALCSRTFDDVAYATTHNAMSNEEDGFIGPNQGPSVVGQLEDGIRGLMLDIHYDGGQVTLCHAFCQLGRTPLVDTLGDIRSFLVRHPYEVVTIIFESYVSAADTEAAFAAAGLLDLVHAQPVGSPWPTLGEMIAADRRLVVLTDRQGGSLPWYHDVWAHASETHYSWEAPEDMNCAPNRGNPANPLFILNHFLTRVFGSRPLAEQVNHNPFFIDRARQCQAERGTLPNFVTVDFHDVGDVLDVVAELNASGG